MQSGLNIQLWETKKNLGSENLAALGMSDAPAENNQMKSSPSQPISSEGAPPTGEKAVGLTFNPSGMPVVNHIKRACANAIDILHNQREQAKAENDGEKIAQFTLAIRSIQEGQMWGVKAATCQY